MHRDGKLELSVAASGDASGTAPQAIAMPPPTLESSSATADTSVAEVKPNVPKRGAGNSWERLMALASFQDESLGDQIKFLLFIALALYLIFNYIRWQQVNHRLERLEQQMHNLERTAKQLLLQMQFGNNQAAISAAKTILEDQVN